MTFLLESYREPNILACGGYREHIISAAEEFACKEHDLLAVNDDPILKLALMEVNCRSRERIAALLNYIKGFYVPSIALEPGTSILNITSPTKVPARQGERAMIIDSIIHNVSMVLLMGVSSGIGAQGYIKEVTKKIATPRQRFPKLTIQVDGGVNSETIVEVIEAGANNLVIGSYITRDEHPGAVIGKIRQQILSLGYNHCAR